MHYGFISNVLKMHLICTTLNIGGISATALHINHLARDVNKCAPDLSICTDTVDLFEWRAVRKGWPLLLCEGARGERKSPATVHTKTRVRGRVSIRRFVSVNSFDNVLN